MLDKGIVLLGSSLGQRVEPVCIVRGTVLNRPALHTLGNAVGNGAVKRRIIVNYINELIVYILWKILEHLLAVEYLYRKILRRTLRLVGNLNRILGERGCHHLKSQL